MVAADLVSINPKMVGDEIKMEITFSNVAAWAPKELLKTEIDLSVWLQFLEDCFQQFKDPSHSFTPGFFTVEVLKSTYKFIGGGTHSFAVPKGKWQRFIEVQIERLYVEGILILNETS